jgi:hypothetical protein
MLVRQGQEHFRANARVYPMSPKYRQYGMAAINATMYAAAYKILIRHISGYENPLPSVVE